MARARGANAIMALAFETAYGTPPGSGFAKVPFVSSQLGEQQNLVASDLLGYGRDPQVPAQDVINNDGDVVVPLDLRNFGRWLKLLLGAPTTAQGRAATGSFTFSGQPTDASTITIGAADWTFVASAPSGDESLIGSTLAETLAAAVRGLNASATTDIKAQTYSLNLAGDTIEIIADTIGTAGNSVALAASSSPDSKATASGADMAGGATGSGPYNHVFASGALALPSAAIEIGLPDVPSYGMNFGAMADKLAVQLQRSGLLNATVSMICQGETRAGSSDAGSPTEAAIERFTQFTGQIRRDGVAIGDVVSGSFTYANNLDKVEVIRPDGRIGGADPAMLSLTGQVVVRFKDTELMDIAVANTAFELAFAWSIGADKALSLVVHNVYIPKPNLPITGPAGIQATYAWQAAEHPTLGKTCTMTLVNDVASY